MQASGFKLNAPTSRDCSVIALVSAINTITFAFAALPIHTAVFALLTIGFAIQFHRLRTRQGEQPIPTEKRT